MKVAVIMGSDSDWDVMAPAVDILKEFEIETEVVVASAHRTPDKVHEFAKGAISRGVGAIIAAAGAAAHLPGVVAAYTTLPVIGVPINSTSLGGMDALLSIAQMPAGIPVACMAINGSKNAGCLRRRFFRLPRRPCSASLRDTARQWLSRLKRRPKSWQPK